MHVCGNTTDSVLFYYYYFLLAPWFCWQVFHICESIAPAAKYVSKVGFKFAAGVATLDGVAKRVTGETDVWELAMNVIFSKYVRIYFVVNDSGGGYLG